MKADGGPYILKCNAKNVAIDLSVTLLFVFIGIAMIPTQPWVGIAICVFFGVVSVVNIIKLLPNSSYLKLDLEGFTVCSLYRPCYFSWSDISHFSIGWVGRKKMVMFDFKNNLNNYSRLDEFNLNLTEHSASLPDTYGKTHEELVDLLNELRSKYEQIGN